jgi:hypothetical protein
MLRVLLSSRYRSISSAVSLVTIHAHARQIEQH